jgi:kinetochore protein Mis12/MTW1
VGYKAVDAVDAGLLGAPISSLGFVAGKDETETSVEARSKDEIENGVHQFETLLGASIDKNFDKVEIYALRSILAIPEELRDWVRLKHYEVCGYPMFLHLHG